MKWTTEKPKKIGTYLFLLEGETIESANVVFVEKDYFGRLFYSYGDSERFMLKDETRENLYMKIPELFEDKYRFEYPWQ